MFKKIEKNIIQQFKDNIQKRIQELEDSSYDFISEAYKINQDKTIEFIKGKRIGGFSIIGKVLKKILIEYILTEFDCSCAIETIQVRFNLLFLDIL